MGPNQAWVANGIRSLGVRDYPQSQLSTIPPQHHLEIISMLLSRIPASLLLAWTLFSLAGGIKKAQPASSPEIVTVLKGHTDTIEAIALSPDGNIAATACFDRYVRLFDAVNGKEIRTYGGQQGHTGQVLCVAFNAKGDQIVSGGSDNFARIWDVPVSFPIKTIPTSAAATRIVVAADGKTFGVASADGTIKVFPAGEEKGALDLKGHIGAVSQLGLTGTTWVCV
jgi:WD40 repeat protein